MCNKQNRYRKVGLSVIRRKNPPVLKISPNFSTLCVGVGCWAVTRESEGTGLRKEASSEGASGCQRPASAFHTCPPPPPDRTAGAPRLHFPGKVTKDWRRQGPRVGESALSARGLGGEGPRRSARRFPPSASWVSPSGAWRWPGREQATSEVS